MLESEKIQKEKDLAGAAKTLHSLGTPDCPVVHRTVSGAPGWTPVNRSLLGKVWRRTAIIHQTVRWCTGLSGEPTVACTNGRPRNLHVTRGLLQRSAGTPDCPVCKSAQRTNGRMRLIWKAIAHRTATVTVRWCTGLYGAPPDRRQVWPSKLASNGS